MADEEAQSSSGAAVAPEDESGAARPRTRIQEWTGAVVLMMLLTLVLLAFLFFVRGVTV